MAKMVQLSIVVLIWSIFTIDVIYSGMMDLENSCFKDKVNLFPPQQSSPIRTYVELDVCGGSKGFLRTDQFVLNCTHLDKNREWDLANFLLDEEQKTKRRLFLSDLINKKLKSPKTILLTTTNHGYLTYFFNWVCSVQQNLVREGQNRRERALNYLKSSLIVLAQDQQAYHVLKNMSFPVISNQLYTAPKYKGMVSAKAAEYFGENYVVTQKTMLYTLAYDILSLGYDFFLFDTDIVWRGNPVAYLEREGQGLDFMATYDYRDIIIGESDIDIDVEGPLNAGVLYGKSTCRSLVAMETIIALNDADKWDFPTDQGTLNMVLVHSPKFRFTRVGILPPTLFVNGHVYDKYYGEPYFKAIDWRKVLQIHISWSGGALEKFKKLSRTKDIYYTSRNCSSYINWKSKVPLPGLNANANAKAKGVVTKIPPIRKGRVVEERVEEGVEKEEVEGKEEEEEEARVEGGGKGGGKGRGGKGKQGGRGRGGGNNNSGDEKKK